MTTGSARRGEVQLSVSEKTLWDEKNTAEEFSPQLMDVDCGGGEWGEEEGVSGMSMTDIRSSLLDESDEMYAEAVEADVVGFIPISGNSMFVVEGWSRTLHRGTVRTSLLTRWATGLSAD